MITHTLFQNTLSDTDVILTINLTVIRNKKYWKCILQFLKKADHNYGSIVDCKSDIDRVSTFNIKEITDITI